MTGDAREAQRGSAIGAIGATSRTDRPGPLEAAPRTTTGEPLPIWLAALVAGDLTVNWSCVSGKAFYTNRSSDSLFISSLGVHLDSGQSIFVTWRPGETEYSYELDRCA
jgi:hypothetical protein